MISCFMLFLLICATSLFLPFAPRENVFAGSMTEYPCHAHLHAHAGGQCEARRTRLITFILNQRIEANNSEETQ